MYLQKALIASACIAAFALTNVNAQAKHEDTEFYTPVPKKVTAGKTVIDAPSDAIVLFDGKDINQWVMTDDRTQPAKWKVANGILTVDKTTGNIETNNPSATTSYI